MHLSLLPPAESREKGQHEGPIAAIEGRTRVVRNSLQMAQVVVESGRVTHDNVVNMMRRIYPTPAVQPVPQETKQALPEISDQQPEENILTDEDPGMNPILLQAYVDRLAPTTKQSQERFDDHQKVA